MISTRRPENCDRRRTPFVSSKLRLVGAVSSAVVAPMIMLLTPVTPSGAVVASSNLVANSSIYQGDPLGNTTQSIGDVGVLSYPNNFVSVSENSSTGTVTVYVTSMNLQMAFALRSLNTVGSTNFALVPQGRAYLDSLNNLVTQGWQTLENAGITMSIWHPELSTGREYIGVVNLTSDQLTFIQQLFGANIVDVQSLSSDQAPVVTSRTYDTAPWDAGDNLHDNSTGQDCSAGFGVNVNGQKELLTAAHCFASGDVITNSLSGVGSQSVIGTVNQRDTSWTGTDTELIPTSASNSIQIGAIGAPVTAYVNGWSTNPAGYQVCESGAFSGNICGLTIASDTIYGDPGTCLTVTLDGGPRIECHLIHANAPAGLIANQAGNSGGPVYRYMGSFLAGVGIISASTPSNTVPCVANVTTCYNDLYYTALDTVLAKWGATLNTH